jgi:YbgC/YbaW family acyl-CoA thioester hydrolase
MRRVRSHREYELRRVSDGCLAAVGQVDWVYIDAVTLFPRRIPIEFLEAFLPNGRSALESGPPLEPSDRVEGRDFVYRHRAKSYELDNLGHVNNANYLNWLNQARLDAFTDVGLNLDVDVVPSPVRYEIEYLAPVMTGDDAEVQSRVVQVGATQMTWAHQILRGDDRLVEAKATVCLRRKGDAGVAFPSALLKAIVG